MLRRKRLAMLVAEFLGTGVLTLAVLSVQRSQLGLAYFVAIGAGLAVLLLTYVFGGVSGAQLNPALTFALFTARRIKLVPAVIYIAAQLLGAWAAYGLYHYFVHNDVQPITQAFSGRILVAEAVGTMVFALGWAAAAYNRFEEGRFAALAGVAFAIGVMVASTASVGLANPALALGTRAWEVVGENGWWNYVVGPLVGGVIGVNLYGLLFADPDRPFGALRGRSAAAGVGGAQVVETVLVEDVDDADDAPAKPAAKRRTTRAASTSSSRSRSKSSSTRKTSASRRKR
jgi:glycerol uptake facilitator-like aquaporin